MVARRAAGRSPAPDLRPSSARYAASSVADATMIQPSCASMGAVSVPVGARHRTAASSARAHASLRRTRRTHARRPPRGADRLASRRARLRRRPSADARRRAPTRARGRRGRRRSPAAPRAAPDTTTDQRTSVGRVDARLPFGGRGRGACAPRPCRKRNRSDGRSVVRRGSTPYNKGHRTREHQTAEDQEVARSVNRAIR